MLARLLSRGARREEQSTVVEAQQAPAAALRAREDALLLFVPDSGMAFRLFSADSEEAAAAFVQQEFPRLPGKPVLFRPFRAGARVDSDQQGEVLVVINDPSRPGTVFLSSFEDTESAESFARFEVRNGLDPNLVSLHAGVPITIDGATPGGAQPVAPVQAPHQAPVAPTVTAAPAQAIPVAQPAPQQQPPIVTARPAVTARVAAVARPAAQPKAAPKQPAAAERPGLIESIRTWPGWDTLPARVKGASTFKWETYDEMRTDPIATSQSRVVVAACAAAAAVGAFWAGPVALVLYGLAGLLGWLACAYLTHWIGTIFFPGRQSPENKQLLFKALAFSHAPRMLVASGLILGAFLPLMPLIVLGVLLWSLVAMVPAIEYSLEIDRQSATLTALTSWLALFAVSFVLPAVLV